MVFPEPQHFRRRQAETPLIPLSIFSGRLYLDSQGAGPFIVAADAYFFWIGAAMRRLEAAVSRQVAGSDETSVEDLLDLQAVVAQHCQLQGLAEPEDIDARRELHLEIFYSRLNEMEEIDDEL
jgi:hypothetical protein